MSFIVSRGKPFEPAPEGTHRAVCCDIVDKGMVPSTWMGKTRIRHMALIKWQIDASMEDGRPFIVRRSYTASLDERSNLRKDLEGWAGKALTDVQAEALDLETLIGKNCLLQIIHRLKDGRTYGNVAAITPVIRDRQGKPVHPPLVVADYIREKDQPHESEESQETDFRGDEEVPF